MADSKAISIRLPDELLAQVNKLAEEKYKSIAGKPNKSLVVQNALVAYFNNTSRNEVVTEDVKREIKSQLFKELEIELTNKIDSLRDELLNKPLLKARSEIAGKSSGQQNLSF
ncbi:MAG: hypothetical protein ACEQSC_01665 [Candidatus Nanopelagicaceae bacterium]